MNILTDIFFLVVITSLTGAFMQMVWMLCAKICGYKNPLIVYAGLRLICVFYLVPIVYVSIWHRLDGFFFEVNDKTDGVTKEWMFSDGIVSVLNTISVLWACFLCIRLMYQLVKYLRWQWILRKKYKERDGEILQRLFVCARHLEIKKIPQLYRRADLKTPLCTGIFWKTIQLPEKQYTKEELDIVFIHELTHIKKHDLELKWISIMITLIHCFNPMVYFLSREISVWSEICCDILACEKGKRIFTTKEYYTSILGMMTEGTQGGLSGIAVTALMEKSSDIARRIRLVKCYKKTKNARRRMAAGWTMTVLFTASAICCVSGKTVMEKYSDCVQETFFVDVEMEPAPSLKEYSIEDVDTLWAFDEELKKSPANAIGEQLCLASGGAYQAEGVYCKSDSYFQVNCTQVEQTDGIMVAGIINEHGNARYVCDTNSLSYTFVIGKGGYYRMFLANVNPSELEAAVYGYRW